MKLGIKQTIQKDWMDKTVRMLLAGIPVQQIRLELDQYLSTKKQSGGSGQRGQKTYGMAISILSAWFNPNPELIPFRDDALQIVRSLPSSEWLPIHWAVISASYPFWHNVANNTGRILNLQDQVSQSQIFSRLKETYGDRETVSRNARYTVRSFVAWGVLSDSASKGCYKPMNAFAVSDLKTCSLLFEAALLSAPERKSSFKQILNSPAYFPFALPFLSSDKLVQINQRITVLNQVWDDATISLTY